MADITMPQLGETVTEGTITRWVKQVGDRVEEDEVIYEVSTDKVDSEVPSPVSGYITEILVQEGETAPVGAPLARVGDQPPGGGGGGGEAAGTSGTSGGGEMAGPATQAEAPGPQAQAADPVAASMAESAGQPETARADAPAAPQQQASAQQPQAAPQAQPAASQAYGQPETPVAPAPEQGAAASSGGESGGGGGRVLSPVVRRLIQDNGLDPAQITGTGTGGRITRADVLAHLDRTGGQAPQRQPQAAPAPAAQAAPSAPSAPSAPAAPRPAPAPQPAARAGDRDTVVPFSNIRKRTAEHMVRSLATSAHTLVVIEVDYANVDSVRTKHKDRFKAEEGTSLTYLPFIARATVDAIREFPHVNASVGDDELIVHGDVNLGIAVDLSFEGLIVPVVHSADSLRLRALARSFSDLAGKARNRKLTADDISGGTFTITNAGGYGTLITGPVINQPQVAILSTDGVKPRPVAVPMPDGGYGIAVHPVGNLAISFDHRAYDGAYASAFLARIKEILETRDWEQEL